MTTLKVFTLFPSTLIRKVRKWWLKRKLAHLSYYLAHIAEQDEHNRHAKRHVHAQMALIQSDLRML